MNDPAVLLYTSDFLTGVIDMTMEERGQYITLLCYQHQKGHIKEETIRLLVGNVSVNVLSHFKKDNDGNYFNKRMDEEKEKRHNFTESRRENGKKGGRPRKEEKTSDKTRENHMDNHMDNHKHNHMGNENDNENKNKKENFIKPTLEEIKQYCIERNNNVDAKKFFDYYETGNWKDAKGNKIKNWKQKLITWETHTKEQVQNKPNWFDKEVKEEQASAEEIMELERRMKR